jgi:hypothetical protein
VIEDWIKEYQEQGMHKTMICSAALSSSRMVELPFMRSIFNVDFAQNNGS